MYNIIAEQVFTHAIHSGLEMVVGASPDIVNRDRMDIGCGALHAAAASDNYGALCLLASIVSCIAYSPSLLQYCLLASIVSCTLPPCFNSKLYSIPCRLASILHTMPPCFIASMVCCM